MRYPRSFRWALPVCLLFVGIAAADDARVVTAAGKVTVKQMPTTLRMRIQFKESGKDIVEALKNMTDRRAAATATLIKLGAVKESIRTGTPTMPADDPQAARMMAMMARNNPGGSTKKKKGPAKVSLIADVSAEWPLDDGNPEELLKAVQSIKDKVVAADLAGQSGKKKLTPEEQEEMEEMEMLQQEYGDRGEQKVGEPQFVFAARIPEDAAQQARAAAFHKATRQAEQLVAAAGKKLGKLRGLQSSGDTGEDYNQYRYGSESVENELSEPSDELQRLSPVFGPVSFTFAIHATFDIDD